MVTQTQIAQALGISNASVSTQKRRGMPVDSIESAKAWRAENMDPGRMRHESDEDQMAARTRREIAEANLAELKEAELRNETIRVESVKASIGVALATIREALLQIPARLAPILASESDTHKVQILLHTEIHAALVHLSTTAERVGNE